MFKFKKPKKPSLLGDDEEMVINSKNEDYQMDDVEDSRQEMMPRKRSHSGSSNKRRKISDRYMLNSSLNDIKPLNDENNDDYDDEEYKKKNKKCLCCSWKCVCLSSMLTIVVIILCLFLVLYFNVAPKFAQNTLDHATMDIVNGTISDPTDSSITLSTTIMISNAGFLDGELKSSTVTVSNNGIKIGTMKMPKLNTIANQNTMVSVESVLQITNVTQFRISCKELLKNIDQTWHLSGNDVTLTVDTGFMGKIDYSVDINKDLVLKGTNLYDFIASDFNVDSATNYTVTTIADLNFISNSIFTFILPDTLMAVYLNDEYIGYAPLPSLIMKPGLNIIGNQSLVIESYPSKNGTLPNRDLLNTFFSNYISGKNQKVKMYGPVTAVKNGQDYPSTVLDGVLSENVIALGYERGTLAFGGLVTSATQAGWTVSTTGKTVRGAYANFLNPLNVPVRIVNLSGIAKLPQTLKYHVDLVKWVDEYDCEADIFARLSIGPGIYKDDPTKTWVDVEANGKSTYFSIADPPKGDSGKCPSVVPIYDFSCCFATLTAAYACSINPGIQKHPSDGQLSSDYMPFELDANITMLIDNKFKIETIYNQGFFPLFFGYEVYGGYATDLELSCKDYTFK